MKETANLPATNAAEETPAPVFKGYSLEELRYQRAMMALKKDFCRDRIRTNFDSLRHPGGRSENGSALSKFQKVANITAKLFANTKVVDIALMGLSLFGSGRKIYKLFGKKK